MTEQHISLAELAETIADNKYILGDRLVEIGISGPNLESSLSSIAMAQAELGHARLIYKWAHELRGINGSKIEIKNQSGKAFEHNVVVNNWIDLIAGLYTTNVAVDLVMRAIVDANHPDVYPPFSKMLNEQHEHILYSRSWCKQLLNDKGSIPNRFKQSLEKAASEVEQWLNKIENDQLLISEKMIQGQVNLVQEFQLAMKEILKRWCCF